LDLLQILFGQISFFATTLTVGFLSVNSGLVTDENVTSFSKIMIRVFIPIMILTVTASSGTRADLLSMGPFFIVACLMFAILLAVAFISAKLLGYKSPLLNVHVCSSAFVNSALLGYPIITVMFPKEVGLAMATFLIAETLVTWTVGAAILTFGTGEGKMDFKKMITPVTVCLIIAVIMVMLEVNPTGIIWDSLHGIGSTQKYTGLIFIGMDIGRRGFKKLFENPKVLFTVPVKLIIGPICVFLILRALNIVSYNYLIIVSIFSMLPTMMLITMLAQEYDCAPDYATGALLCTTVSSLATMPLVFWLITSIL